uniref:Structural maintenance of chromosomes protein 6 n=1 Tax=Cyprinus carpio carpio TaxID=630221 RepID=A0A9J7YLP0_CYPCA
MSKRKSSNSGQTPDKRSRLSQPEPSEEDETGYFSSGEGLSTSQSEVGIIESISLKNFMCHSMLGPFAFGPNVNFVVGNNGSGKSAVLTALIVALGGKALTTNRGSSLKGFVKEGESSADVSITLRNRGRDAYKPEVFGQSITVDLRISSEGIRTYKLRSKTGHLVSSKKEELISILDHFNIQVDNPVSILTQEMSKHFLHSKGEGDKYKFFMKATQLDQMKEDYSYIMKTKTMTQNTTLQELKRKYHEKEERYKSLASLDEMQKKLDELKNQMAWALVRNHCQRNMSCDCMAQIKMNTTILSFPNQILSLSYYRIIFLQDQLEGVTQRMQQLQPQCAELKSRAQARNRDLKAAEVPSRFSCFHLNSDRIIHKKKSSLIKIGKKKKKHFTSGPKLLGLLDLKCATKMSLFLILILFFDPSHFVYLAIFLFFSFCSLEKQDLLRALESKRRDLAAMESSRDNRLCRFGEHMPALLRAIDEADQRGLFRKKPVGPLGFCIRLRDPELGLAVECCLKALMLAFCCDNHADERELQRIMSRHFQQGRRPQIIVSKFTNTVYDVRGRAVDHDDYPTVLKALEIENPVVANCLIDMRGIETILLIKNAKDARRVMQSEARPRNCREAFTREGDQVYYNRYYSSEQNRALYLSGDVEEEIRFENMKCIFEMSGFFSECCRKLQAELTELQNVEEPQSEDLKPLVTNRFTHYKDKCFSGFLCLILEQLSNSDEELARSKHHKKHYEEKRKAHVDMIETLKKNLYEKDQLLQVASIAKAAEICPERLDVRRTAKSLDSEISRLRHKLNTQQDQQGQRDTIVRQFHEAKENFNNIARQVKGLEAFIRQLTEIMNTRHYVYSELRMYLSVRCKYYFDSMLSQRGYIGKMTFDHKNETLSISVQPGEGGKASLSDMRSLSGGERSFSTVCFVLSLWAIAEAPFRALDEFDVYMDMVNRRISMDMMLKIAASQRYRQFIFLTPQSMSSLPDNRLIHILRLSDPDRSQSAIPFGQRNPE